jgi:hypothetical protein
MQTGHANAMSLPARRTLSIPSLHSGAPSILAHERRGRTAAIRMPLRCRVCLVEVGVILLSWIYVLLQPWNPVAVAFVRASYTDCTHIHPYLILRNKKTNIILCLSWLEILHPTRQSEKTLA